MTCSASSHAPNATVPRAWRRLLDRMREPLASAGHAGPARQTADRPTVLLPLSYKQVQARFCHSSPGRVSHLLASIHILLQCLNAPKLSCLMDAACLAQCVAPVGRGTCQCDSGVLCPTQGSIAIWSGRKRLGSPEKQGKPAFHTADGFFFACRQQQNQDKNGFVLEIEHVIVWMHSRANPVPFPTSVTAPPAVTLRSRQLHS